MGRKVEPKMSLDEYSEQVDIGSMTLEEIQDLCMVSFHALHTPGPLSKEPDHSLYELAPGDIVSLSPTRAPDYESTHTMIETRSARYAAKESPGVIRHRMGRARMMQQLLRKHIQEQSEPDPILGGMAGKKLSDVIDMKGERRLREEREQMEEGEEDGATSSLVRDIRGMCQKREMSVMVLGDVDPDRLSWDQCPICGGGVEESITSYVYKHCDECNWSVGVTDDIPGESPDELSMCLKGLCSTGEAVYIVVGEDCSIIPAWNACPACGGDLDCTGTGKGLEKQECCECDWAVLHHPVNGSSGREPLSGDDEEPSGEDSQDTEVETEEESSQGSRRQLLDDIEAWLTDRFPVYPYRWVCSIEDKDSEYTGNRPDCWPPLFVAKVEKPNGSVLTWGSRSLSKLRRDTVKEVARACRDDIDCHSGDSHNTYIDFTFEKLRSHTGLED